MKTYDIIVIGSGAGMTIVEGALSQGLKVALLDKGPLGGTCLNLGCVPSKLLIFPADRIVEIQDSKKLGLEVELKHVNFESIFERMRKTIREEQGHIRDSIKLVKNLDYFEGQAHFTQDFTLDINVETIKGKKIFIAAGSRPMIPPVKGIENIDYLTSDTVLKLTQKPESILIIGGGYIGVEYGHFFAAMGSKVTIIEMADRLVQGEEPEISDLLKQKMSQRMDIFLNVRALEIKRSNKKYTVIVKNADNGVESELSANAVLVAAGRKPNSDWLSPENTGVEIDKRGFIQVDDYLETTQKNIYAVGDIIGKYMFTHVVNREAMLVWHNAMHEQPVVMDYSTIPHAVFTYPQIASVGLTEAEARKNHHILVGVAKYSDMAKGIAMMEEDGFAKAIVDSDTGKILGFHIIGPEASTLIQEVINAMANGGNIDLINRSIHIHPAMPEIVVRALNNLEEPKVVEIRPERLKVAMPRG